MFNAYPNPTAGALTVEFQLAKTTEVDLALYDLTGRRMVELSNSTLEAGYQQITWDTRDQALSADIYMLRLKTEAGIRTQRLIIQQ